MTPPRTSLLRRLLGGPVRQAALLGALLGLVLLGPLLFALLAQEPRPWEGQGGQRSCPMPLPPIPPFAVDPATKLYRLNHPAFLLHVVRCSLVCAREEHGARWWEPRVWRFIWRNLRDRARANATE